MGKWSWPSVGNEREIATVLAVQMVVVISDVNVGSDMLDSKGVQAFLKLIAPLRRQTPIF